MKKNQSLAALSLIEILIAVALISIIISGLALMMLHSNRNIQETRLRSAINDQAQSCLDNFRNLRDGNPWTFFCQRLNAKRTGSFTLGSAYNATTGFVPEITFQDATNTLILCPKLDEYGVQYHLKFSGGSNFNIGTPCNDQRAKVTLTVRYQDHRGTEKDLAVEQIFQKTESEAAYN